MFDHIDLWSSLAVYQQIENHVLFAIASGRLKPGDQLPSVRELSERLGVNPNTVAKAYRDLEVMGLLFTRRGTGLFIRPGVEADCRANCLQWFLRRLHDVVAGGKAAGMLEHEIMAVVQMSMDSDSALYAAVPPKIAAMAKSIARGKST